MAEPGSFVRPVAVMTLPKSLAQAQQPTTIGLELAVIGQRFVALEVEPMQNVRDSPLEQSTLALESFVRSSRFITNGDKLGSLLLEMEGQLLLVSIQSLPPLFQAELLFRQRG